MCVCVFGDRYVFLAKFIKCVLYLFLASAMSVPLLTAQWMAQVVLQSDRYT